MKIVSNFYDYYDSVAYSDEPLFIRNEQEVISKESGLDTSTLKKVEDIFKHFPRPQVCTKNLFSSVTAAFLCFCGKFYPIFQYDYHDKDLRYHIISACGIKNFLKEANIHGFEPKLRQSFWSIKYNKQGFVEGITQFSKDFEVNSLAYTLNLHFKTPIVIIKNRIPSGNIYIKNPMLADYRVQQTIDPWTAYQEIEMFLGTILVKNFDMNPKFSDELKRDSKGFDNMSFKQVGPKKRKRK